MDIKIFYSWQSDLPASINRTFIQEALQSAIDRIRADESISIEPALDRDTKDIPGSPAIAETILEKIGESQLFLGDVTFITPKNAKRATPNPNVMIELGYGASQLGWERIICVMNQEFGGPSKLPFDLKHRRWPIRYRLASNVDEIKLESEKVRLSEQLEEAILDSFNSGILTKDINPKDIRVARKFQSALNLFLSNLHEFARDKGFHNLMSVFQENHEDQVNTRYPNPSIVEPLIVALSTNDLQTTSNLQIGGEPQSWITAFIYSFQRLAQDCNGILNHYAQRDDSLIELIEETHNRSNIIAFSMEVCITNPDMSYLYENGIPDVHIDYFRYHLLSILKSYRVTRQFNNNLE